MDLGGGETENEAPPSGPEIGCRKKFKARAADLQSGLGAPLPGLGKPVGLACMIFRPPPNTRA
jgi:hypothetical protein